MMTIAAVVFTYYTLWVIVMVCRLALFSDSLILYIVFTSCWNRQMTECTMLNRFVNSYNEYFNLALVTVILLSATDDKRQWTELGKISEFNHLILHFHCLMLYQVNIVILLYMCCKNT